MKNLMLFYIVIGCASCGQAPTEPTGLPNIPDSSCDVRDSCTYADVLGYQCEALRWEPYFGDGANLPSSFYAGALCVITKEDYQTEPGCDPSNPPVQNGGWGSNGGAYCPTVQGPGPASVIQ